MTEWPWLASLLILHPLLPAPTCEALIDFHLGLGPREALEARVRVDGGKAGVADHLAAAAAGLAPFGFALLAHGYDWVRVELLEVPAVPLVQLQVGRRRWAAVSGGSGSERWRRWRRTDCAGAPVSVPL